MSTDISLQDNKQRGGLFRGALLVMSVIAVIGYAVAFVQSERGTVHYNAYVEAYTDCYRSIVDSGSALIDCNQVPEVRQHLMAHRDAIAVGEPFFNLALSLTAVVVLLPLIRRWRQRLGRRQPSGSDDPNSTVRQPA